MSLSHLAANTIVVLDFETTGLSPKQGDRAIEIGAVKLVDGQVVDRFSELMDPGFRVSGFIESYTGISNSMLAGAPACAEVMHRFADFIQGCNMLAHNASFDQKFLDAELAAISRDYQGSFVCSLLIGRRIYPNAPNHKLGTLVEYKGVQHDGVFHRALADAEMTAKLWLAMLADCDTKMTFKQMHTLSKTPKAKVPDYLSALT
ncbi:PolC-type DNA polymerase III [Ferrimonas lipolytica]|uniref:DNA-directed DNA polymerase n=1 Tax=Ferrimonas lipolytica TaxID=2724191 RepID=A0A6H1UEU3_9GAMM|nr:3'-5' exonuclease [Ferrimonas lipolytica]QIZ77149.1 3'-5' exonuclease [Ferrimonas lipolytica]